MNPPSPRATAPRPSRTGLGWLLQCFLRPKATPPEVEAVFPASERHPASETFAASGIIGLWSLIVTLHLSLQTAFLPGGTLLRLVIGLLLWIACLHLTVILPMLAFPLLRLLRLNTGHLARLIEATLILLLTGLAWQLTLSDSNLAASLGFLWITLIMAEIVLRLARAGIALASRSH
jgi:hypothetical protein